MREDVPALEAIKPGGKAHPIDRGAARRRRGDARRHDARRASDAGPHARLHDLDDEGAGGRQDLQRGVRLQLSRARRRVTPDDRERVQSHVQDRALAAVRRAARRSSGAVQHDRRSTRGLNAGGPNPFIDPAQLLARGGNPGSDVPRAAPDAAEGCKAVDGSALEWRAGDAPRAGACPAVAPTGVVAAFERLQEAQLASVRDSDGLPIDRVTIASRFNARLKYNLYAAMTILPRHQHRHLWQAEQHPRMHSRPGASGERPARRLGRRGQSGDGSAARCSELVESRRGTSRCGATMAF